MRVFSIIALMLVSSQAVRLYVVEDPAAGAKDAEAKQGQAKEKQATSEAKPHAGTAVDDTRSGKKTHECAKEQ